MPGRPRSAIGLLPARSALVLTILSASCALNFDVFTGGGDAAGDAGGDGSTGGGAFPYCAEASGGATARVRVTNLTRAGVQVCVGTVDVAAVNGGASLAAGQAMSEPVDTQSAGDTRFSVALGVSTRGPCGGGSFQTSPSFRLEAGGVYTVVVLDEGGNSTVIVAREASCTVADRTLVRLINTRGSGRIDGAIMSMAVPPTTWDWMGLELPTTPPRRADRDYVAMADASFALGWIREADGSRFRTQSSFSVRANQRHTLVIVSDPRYSAPVLYYCYETTAATTQVRTCQSYMTDRVTM